MNGLFIVFEGLDGSGLTTQSAMLGDYLTNRNKHIVMTKEQTDGFIGGLIKSRLKKEWKTSPVALQLLFAADRAHHLAAQIEPALEKDKIVISDRYFFSTYAFGSLDIDMKFLENINFKFRKPDITFIIDTDPEECFKRIKRSRSHLELFEDINKSKRIRENYLSLKNSIPNVFVINGNRPKEEVFNEIVNIVKRFL